jgi:hypothetical protein
MLENVLDAGDSYGMNKTHTLVLYILVEKGQTGNKEVEYTAINI